MASRKSRITPDRDKVRKLIHEWKRTGKITTSRAVYRPRTKKEAIRQALAIEYGRERSRKRKE